jgi:hypothetical protein
MALPVVPRDDRDIGPRPRVIDRSDGLEKGQTGVIDRTDR